jgi:hypothetical protein
VQLIGATRTSTGLRVKAKLDLNSYNTGIKVTNAEFAGIRLIQHRFHGDWNYTIEPNQNDAL